MRDWPFAEPKNVVTLTVRQITDKELPILHVCHDLDDGMWQFLTGEPVDMDDAMLVSLKEVFDIDPSIGELADLLPGWIAGRAAPGQPWQREPQPLPDSE